VTVCQSEANGLVEHDRHWAVVHEFDLHARSKDAARDVHAFRG
jgi:hypothetical protein